MKTPSVVCVMIALALVCAGCTSIKGKAHLVACAPGGGMMGSGPRAQWLGCGDSK